MSAKKALRHSAPLLLLTAIVGALPAPGGDRRASPAPAARPHGTGKRAAWTTSRIKGAPEPPPPYRIERAFPALTFKNPLLLARAPGGKRLFVGEQAGKIYSFPEDSAAGKKDLFLDLAAEVHSWDPAGKVRGVGALYGL